MSGAVERVFIDGGAGKIETVVDRPADAARGAALVAHPHPLYGGTLDNKVVQTLARTFAELDRPSSPKHSPARIPKLTPATTSSPP